MWRFRSSLANAGYESGSLRRRLRDCLEGIADAHGDENGAFQVELGGFASNGLGAATEDLILHAHRCAPISGEGIGKTPSTGTTDAPFATGPRTGSDYRI